MDLDLPEGATGAYILLISNDGDCRLGVGRLGELSFPRGGYAYVGSAMGRGSTSLKNRIARHLKPAGAKKAHWHVDYFLASPTTRILEVGVHFSGVGRGSLECQVSRLVSRVPGVSIPHPGFGSSDCRSCESHLYYLGTKFRKTWESVKVRVVASSGERTKFFIIRARNTKKGRSKKD
ncbi:MAG: GIY-YIG nuclease family protein [Promethearchaeota archaeon]